jgi:hypothetical protein
VRDYILSQLDDYFRYPSTDPDEVLRRRLEWIYPQGGHSLREDILKSIKNYVD